MLDFFRITDIGDLQVILKTASHCLHVYIPTLFESQVTSDYPTVCEIVAFVKSRVIVCRVSQLYHTRQVLALIK